MLKVLLKSAVLFLIIMSVYIIVNPSACSNMLAGKERMNNTEGVPNQQYASPSREQNPDIRSAPRHDTDSEEMFSAQDKEQPIQGIMDTNTLQQENKPVYSQEDIDYAIASRYVELEREYTQNHTVGKDTSREISFIVMDDFEMSPTEWESFLSRATATGLFEKVRKELPHTPGN